VPHVLVPGDVDRPPSGLVGEVSIGAVPQQVSHFTLRDPAAALPRTNVRCTNVTEGTMHARLTAQAAERARSEAWRYHELPADHGADDMPQEVAALLLELA
jgi:hypothetical protein